MTGAVLIALAMLAGSCLISLMAVFMGGGQQGDLHSLLLLQLGTMPLTLGLLLYVLQQYGAEHGYRNGLAKLWSDLPQWLVFIFLLLNSLAVAGEVALIITHRSYGDTVSWHQHVPLACLLLASLAFCACYARQQQHSSGQPPLRGRWPRPDESRPDE